MWQQIARTLQEAIAEGESEASFNPSHEFKQALRHSADVFAAFKVHRMGRDLAQRLTDENGNLRSFSQWKEQVLPIASHQCHQWLRTEYDTAVLRAHGACEWQQFEAERDVLPNLKWIPSTSPTPGADHQLFWNTVLPIDHPFWASHRPGDRWNCKCQLAATAEPATSEPTPGKHDHPHNGLENNTGKDGHLFSDKHPYFPSSCGSCSLFQAKAPITARAKHLFLNRKKDCHNCPYANQMVQQAESREEEYSIVPTHKGKVRLHAKHGKTEKKANVATATYFAEKYEHEIDLLPTKDGDKEADTNNKTLGYKQEYKHVNKHSKNAIEEALRKGYKQADHLVIVVTKDMPFQLIEKALRERLHRCPNIVEITFLRNGKDASYSREQMIRKDFKIQQDDFK